MSRCPTRGPTAPARHRVMAALIVAGSLAALVVVAYSVQTWQRGEVHARRYDGRIHDVLARSTLPQWFRANNPEWRTIEANLHALALAERPACGEALARWAAEPRLDALAVRAMRLILRHYPEHRYARGVREYERLIEHGYFFNSWYWDRSKVSYLEVDAKQREGLRWWLGQYHDHPGRDDALVRLASAALSEGEPLESVTLLHEALHAGDGDRFPRCHTNIRWVLDRDCTASQLVEWLDGDCPAHLVPLVTYFAGVHSMREKRYDDAVRLIGRFLALEGPLADELGAWLESLEAFHSRALRGARGGCLGIRHVDANADRSMRKKVTAQLELCRSLATRRRTLDGLDEDDGARAVALYELGRLCFRHPRDFRNAFVNPRYAHPWGWDGDDENDDVGACLDALPLDLGFRQAADWFRRVVADHPDTSQAVDAAYSIPLCLWRTHLLRLQELGTSTGKSFQLAIARGFQDFADRHPESSMADEALYQAGVHFYWVSRWRSDDPDTTRIVANMRRIATDYPDGNIVAEYAEKNEFLCAAISWASWTEEEREAAAPTGAETVSATMDESEAATSRAMERDAETGTEP